MVFCGMASIRLRNCRFTRDAGLWGKQPYRMDRQVVAVNEPERLPCAHCGSIESTITESRPETDTLSQRKYKCHHCRKSFWVAAECHFRYDDEQALVYTLRLTPGKVSEVKAKKLESGECQMS